MYGFHWEKLSETCLNFLVGEVKDVRTLDGLDCSSFDVAIDKGMLCILYIDL